MSIRLGRSRTCFRREKFLRARGAVTRVVKVRTASLGETACGCADGRAERRGTDKGTEIPPPYARDSGRGRRRGGRMVARAPAFCQNPRLSSTKAPFGAFGGGAGAGAAARARFLARGARRARGGRSARRAGGSLEGGVPVPLVSRPRLPVD